MLYLAPLPSKNRFERVVSLKPTLSGYKEGKLVVPNLKSPNSRTPSYIENIFFRHVELWLG